MNVPIEIPVRRRFEMPLLLLCGLGFSAFFSALGAIVFTIFAITIPFTTSYSVDGHPATRAEFFAASWPSLGILPVLLLFVAVAFALWRELPWSRPLILGLWGANLVLFIGLEIWGPVKDRGDWTPVFVFPIMIAIVWWYLYRKATVVAYYRVLEQQVRENALGAG
jgi:hypothetical protein